MTNQPFDRAVTDWLESGSDQTPSAAIDAVLLAVRTTPQERRGFLGRWPLSNMGALAGAAWVLIVAVVGIGVLALEVGQRGNQVGGPSPTTIPSPAPFGLPLPNLDATFVSPAYGYQIRYPTAWTVTRGTPPWAVGTGLMPDNPTTDKILSPVGTQRVRLSGASLLLPSGTTIDAFRRNAVPLASPFNPSPCTPVAPLQGSVLLNVQTSSGASPQQVQAVVSINGCDALAELGGHVYDVEAIAGGRGYEFTIDGEITAADALAWLDTITLDPASAPVASASPSPASTPRASP
jgi:hypothetical protein